MRISLNISFWNLIRNTGKTNFTLEGIRIEKRAGGIFDCLLPAGLQYRQVNYRFKAAISRPVTRDNTRSLVSFTVFFNLNPLSPNSALIIFKTKNQKGEGRDLCPDNSTQPEWRMSRYVLPSTQSSPSTQIFAYWGDRKVIEAEG